MDTFPFFLVHECTWGEPGNEASREHDPTRTENKFSHDRLQPRKLLHGAVNASYLRTVNKVIWVDC